jgi:hypothetical protein
MYRYRYWSREKCTCAAFYRYILIHTFMCGPKTEMALIFSVAPEMIVRRRSEMRLTHRDTMYNPVSEKNKICFVCFIYLVCNLLSWSSLFFLSFFFLYFRQRKKYVLRVRFCMFSFVAIVFECVNCFLWHNLPFVQHYYRFNSPF